MNIFTPVSTCRTGITVEWFPLKYFVQSLSRRHRVIACGIEIGIVAVCVVARFELRKKMIFQGDIRIIFLKRKCIAFKKNYTSLVISIFGKFPSDRRNISGQENWKNWKIERFRWLLGRRIFRPVANLAWSRLRGGNKEEGNARDLVARKTGGQLLPSGFIGNKYF